MRKSLKNSMLALIVLLQSACVIEVKSGDHGHGHDVSKIFGGIEISEGSTANHVDSVNGSIILRDKSTADRVETVNGSIRIYDDVSVHSVETVNGSIRAGRNFKVDDEVTTVNGGIELQAGTVVRDTVSTVNGTIRLKETEVHRDVQTVNGDIRLIDGSVVKGDVIFESNGSFFHRDTGKPRLVVDANSTIEGSIHLYRKVRLEIDDNAVVGEIIEHY
jgi:DUF4097 and DUF4098 domain-containing protein YvlB